MTSKELNEQKIIPLRRELTRLETAEELLQDINKDLNNNYYGHIMGKNNKNKRCADLLDELRTKRMKDENIK